MSTMREQFEAWQSKQGRALRLAKEDSGEYCSSDVQSDWESWQAATEAAKPNICTHPEGCTSCNWCGFKAEAAKATGTAGDLPPLPEEIEVGGEGWGWEDFQSEKTFSVEHMLHYGAACAQAAFAEAARHDKDGNHADDLRGMLEELQTEFDKQQSAFWACSEKLAQVQRNQETDLSDIRILELAEEDFGEQDDRNVKNEALLSFARKVQAARQPAPVVAVTRIDTGYGNYLEFERKTTGKSGWLVRTESGDLVRALNPTEVLLVDSALAATAAPVLSDEQIDAIGNRTGLYYSMMPSFTSFRPIVKDFITEILAAIRSQP